MLICICQRRRLTTWEDSQSAVSAEVRAAAAQNYPLHSATSMSGMRKIVLEKTTLVRGKLKPPFQHNQALAFWLLLSCPPRSVVKHSLSDRGDEQLQQPRGKNKNADDLHGVGKRYVCDKPGSSKSVAPCPLSPVCRTMVITTGFSTHRVAECRQWIGKLPVCLLGRDMALADVA